MWLCAFLITLAVLIAVGILFLVDHRKSASARKAAEELTQRSLMLEQTVTSLVGAADAKDGYVHGHSVRVAECAKKLAELKGMDESTCRDIFFALLLHKVGIEVPDGLKGAGLPDLDKILAVAESYDQMLIGRSEQGQLLQQKIREEFIKGTGTQYDSEYARLMIHIIDMDSESDMKEREESRELEKKEVIGSAQSIVADGILINADMTTVRLTVESDCDIPDIAPEPSLILFDSLDGKAHTDEGDIKEFLFFKYGEIWFNGRTMTSGARKMETRSTKTRSMELEQENRFKIEAVRVKDHALIRVIAQTQVNEIIVALPDSSRFMYIGLAGENLRFSQVSVEKSGESVPSDFIPRIAEEISYIDGPVGDIPNVQVDGFRTDSSKGILINDGMVVRFHTKSLPTARLVWHCPYINIFSSDDGQVNGENYRDFSFVRLDGEHWENDSSCKTEITVSKDSTFGGWDAWQNYNKEGYDCTVTFGVEGKTITILTDNAGIRVESRSKLPDSAGTIYAALTGDQVAITDIRIRRGK